MNDPGNSAMPAMNRLRRMSLLSLVVFLSFTALLAIAALLSGEFGETQLRIILSTLTISAASICAMACSAFVEKRNYPVPGSLGMAFALLAALMVLYGIWFEPATSLYWKTTSVLAVLAGAFAHALLLCIPSLDARYRWSQAALVICVTLLAGQIILAITREISALEYFRMVGVTAVVVVLLTITVPIFMKLSAAGAARKEPPGQQGETLALTHEQGDRYRDSRGVRYRVTRL